MFFVFNVSNFTVKSNVEVGGIYLFGYARFLLDLIWSDINLASEILFCKVIWIYYHINHNKASATYKNVSVI